MKKTIVIASLLLGGFAFQSVTAQVHTTVKINIGSQPVWGPVGYDQVQYYYMPDIDTYYNVPTRKYYYQDKGRWVSSGALPHQYRDYDIYNGYKVVINEPKPYRHAETYRTKYAEYKNHHDQQIIRNSHESKYFQIKEHPEHDKWRKDHNNHKRQGNHNGRQ